MRIFSTSLPLFALLLGLTIFISSCDDDDDGIDFPTESELTLDNGWVLTAVSNNLIGREDEIAGLFTDAELTDEGLSRAEIVEELQFLSAFYSITTNECQRNDTLTFVSGGDLEYDYSDDCAGSDELFIFDEEAAPYNWALNDRLLTITSMDGVVSYTITRLTDTTLELSIDGDRALAEFGEFETVRDFGVTFTVTLTAQ